MRYQIQRIENQELALRCCLLLILVWGIVMTFMIPPWQTPDEGAHLQMMGESFKIENLHGQLLEELPLDGNRIRFNYNEKVNMEDWKAAMTKPANYDKTKCLPKGISLSVIKHLPASLGIMLGVVLHLPVFWVLELGELFALIFYLAVCSLAFWIMPVKKEVLLLVMTFPMSIQQAASLSYDAVLLPLCFLYIAYLFYMRDKKEKLGWREVCLTLLLLYFITYIKIPYFLLGLLVFILPKEKICLKVGPFTIDGKVIEKWRIPVAVVLLCLLAILLYMKRYDFWIQLVSGMVLEWKRSVYLYATTIKAYWKYLLVSSVGQFGWLESRMPALFVLGSYLLLLVFAVWGKARENVKRMRGRTRAYIWVVFLILSVFIMMSMVNHTIMTILFGSEFAYGEYKIREALYQIPYIGGLQGRYFLPFLPLPFLALPGGEGTVKWKNWMAAAYIFIAMLITVCVLYKRYWVG